MDKTIIRQRILALEAHELQDARDAYLTYLAGARLDRSQPIDSHDQAQAELASDLSEALDGPVHHHADKIEKLNSIDFGPKSKVEEGALVTFGIDASHGYERIHQSALVDVARLLIAYVESPVEIERDANPLAGVKGFTHQPTE